MDFASHENTSDGPFATRNISFLFQKIKLLILPSRKWGPALVKHRELVDYVHGFVADPDKEDGYLNKGYSWSSIISTPVSRP